MSDDSAARIVHALRSRIASASPGSPLPSTRALAAEFGAGPVTVQRAVRELSSLGLVESRPGVGNFVRDSAPTRAADYGWQTAAMGTRLGAALGLSATQRAAVPDAIRLHSGYPTAELLPGRLVRSALSGAARADAALDRSPTAGLPGLRAWFADQLAASAPPGASGPAGNDVLVVPGSQSGLSSILRALVGSGGPLVVESPTYWGTVLAARQIGIPLVPVPTGPDGPDPEEVDRALGVSGARVFYAQPSFANPTGTTWSGEVRQGVLEVARRRGAFVVEDDWAHDLGMDADVRPLAGYDDDGHVVYVRSLTKSVSPALRVAAVVARGPARERILAEQAAESMHVSALLQAAALDVVTRPAWPTHLRGLRRDLRRRRDLLLDALGRHSADVHVDRVPDGGLNLWARLPGEVDPELLARACETAGLLVAAGTEWFPAEPSAGYLRLNFAGEDPARFDEAARILGECLHDADAVAR